MRSKLTIAGIAAGGVLALGGVATADLATGDAEAQSSGGQTASQAGSAELKAANQRSQAAIRLSKDLQNRLGKYLQPEGLLIGANPPPPPIRQDRGTGDGGLPTGVIKNEAITSEKIAPGGVTSGDLADNSVTTRAISNGSVTPDKIANGLVVEVKEEFSITPGSGVQDIEVFCPVGRSPIGGGWAATFKAQVYSSYAESGGWKLTLENPATETTSTITVCASCIANQAALG